MKHFYFRDRNGQTPLPDELKKGLIPKHAQTIEELDEYEEANIAEGLNWLEGKEHRYFCEKLRWPVPSWGQVLKTQPEVRRTTYIESLNHARDAKKYDLLINFMYS